MQNVEEAGTRPVAEAAANCDTGTRQGHPGSAGPAVSGARVQAPGGRVPKGQDDTWEWGTDSPSEAWRWRHR